MVLALSREQPGRWSFSAKSSVCNAADAEITQEVGQGPFLLQLLYL